MRLDNVFAASPDGFSLASTSMAPRHRPKPCRSTHQVREATRVTVSPSLAFLLQLPRQDLLLFDGPSGRFHRQFRFISGIAREHRPDDPRVLVGKRHRRNICMSPLPQFSEPKASWVLLAASSPQDSAGTVDHQRAQASIAALADAN
jgi:hypothetical protein